MFLCGSLLFLKFQSDLLRHLKYQVLAGEGRETGLMFEQEQGISIYTYLRRRKNKEKILNTCEF